MANHSEYTSSATIHSSTACNTQARDTYFECLAKVDPDYTTDKPIPKQCQGVRKQFEKHCRASWVCDLCVCKHIGVEGNVHDPPYSQVKHFDKINDRRAILARTIQSNIAKQSVHGTGVQAGKSHQ